MSGPRILLESDIPGLRRVNRGKVRDIYEMGSNLVIVATDRISAFDSILPTGIPHKGRVLTQLTLFWLDLLKDVTANHLITADVDRMGDAVRACADDLRGRTMMVMKANVFPIECVVRGYLAGSGWASYKAGGKVCGIKLPAGLRESEKLPEVIFTPATKAESGHDINIPFRRMVDLIGRNAATALRSKSVDIYTSAEEFARKRGIIICDTKFEWGEVDGEVTLIDEVLTPDSSRFWPADQYKPGGPQPSFDKQYVRDWLEQSGWDKEPPAPPLPDDVARKTSEKYVQAYENLTGQKLY